MKMKARNITAILLALLLAATATPLSPVYAQTTVSIVPTPVGAGSMTGDLVSVDVVVTNVLDLDAWEASISYDPAVLTAVDASYVQVFDVDRMPTLDNTNGFLVGGQSSVFPPGSSYAGNLTLMTLTFQVLCNACSTALHFADSKLSSFAGAIAHTAADGLFSNGTPVTRYADLNGRRAWAEHNRFMDRRDGPVMSLFARADSFGDGATSAYVTFTMLDVDAGIILGVFTSSVHAYSFQGEKHTFMVDVPKHPLSALSDDPLLLYNDANATGNGVRDLGEQVVYDEDGDGVAMLDFDTPIAGNMPADNTLLSDDPHILYIDANGNGVLDRIVGIGATESVVYDANMNGFYDFGEQALAGPNPPTGYVVGHHYSIVTEAVYDINGDGTPDTAGVNDKIFAVVVSP